MLKSWIQKLEDGELRLGAEERSMHTPRPFLTGPAAEMHRKWGSLRNFLVLRSQFPISLSRDQSPVSRFNWPFGQPV